MREKWKMKSALRSIPLIKQLLDIHSDVSKLTATNEALAKILTDIYINEYMRKNPKYQNAKNLHKFEYRNFSQSSTDGIINEIFSRIGAKTKFFVEFGVTSGLEENTVSLLLNGWKGAWIEARQEALLSLAKRCSAFIDSKRLFLKNAFITAENIQGVFKELNIPKEFDLLSIDIEGNDFWVWKAITDYHPRVVIVEYNSIFMPPVKWVMKYDPQHRWDGSTYYGASLKSWETLAFGKGYKLVGCDFYGLNAFFVRDDLIEDKFLEPFTAENHYEPPRLHLVRKIDYPRNFGEFEAV